MTNTEPRNTESQPENRGIFFRGVPASLTPLSLWWAGLSERLTRFFRVEIDPLLIFGLFCEGLGGSSNSIAGRNI